jgi:hypothetical protein
MSKHYFINRQQGEEGPFTYNELANMRLLDNTKVWYEGLVDWKNITDVDDLADLVIKRPLPIKKEPTVNPTPKKPKYDGTYYKHDEAIFLGIILLVATLLVNYWFGTTEFSSKERFDSTRLAIRITSLIIRIIVIFYVVNIARLQNRNTTGWGLFAFFLPSIALIIIGTQKKLFVPQIEETDYNITENKIYSNDVESYAENNSKDKNIIYTEIPKNKYVKKVLLQDGSYLQFATDLGYMGGSIVFIKDKIPLDGFYKATYDNKVYLIKNGKTETEYYIEKYEIKGVGVLEVYCDFTFGLTKECPVYLSGLIAPDGNYKTGLFSNIIVKDGVVV